VVLWLRKLISRNAGASHSYGFVMTFGELIEKPGVTEHYAQHPALPVYIYIWDESLMARGLWVRLPDGGWTKSLKALDEV